jgi:GT2 family glycosyltransferase
MVSMHDADVAPSAPHHLAGGWLSASVVVAMQGDQARLTALLTALRQQTVPHQSFELVLVDNNREPRLDVTRLRNLPMSCRVLYEPVPGLSRARNRGLRAAKGSYLLITDADSVPEPGWIGKHLAALTTTGALLAGGPARVRWTGVPHRRLNGRLTDWFVPRHWPSDVARLEPPTWLIGCNLAMRREEPPWLFDESLGVVGDRHRSCEDLELVLRAELAGQLVIAVPDAVIQRSVHEEDITVRRLAARAWWHGWSMARLRKLHPAAQPHDSYSAVTTVLRRLRPPVHEPSRSLALDLTRIAGYHSGRLLSSRPDGRSRLRPSAGHTKTCHESTEKRGDAIA